MGSPLLITEAAKLHRFATYDAFPPDDAPSYKIEYPPEPKKASKRLDSDIFPVKRA